MKVITTITTIYDTETKEVTEHKVVTERVDYADLFGVAPSLLQLQPNIRYTDTVCAKCDIKIAVQVAEYSLDGNYCHPCAMAKVGA